MHVIQKACLELVHNNVDALYTSSYNLLSLLMLSILGKIFSRQHFEILLTFRIGSGLSLDRHWRHQHFQTTSLKPLGQLKPNYMWRLHEIGEQKFVHNVWVTWPRWLTCQYKPDMKHLRLGLYPSLFKWWSLVDLDLFYRTVKFYHLSFCMGKRQTVDISEAIVAYDIKVDINVIS